MLKHKQMLKCSSWVVVLFWGKAREIISWKRLSSVHPLTPAALTGCSSSFPQTSLLLREPLGLMTDNLMNGREGKGETSTVHQRIDLHHTSTPAAGLRVPLESPAQSMVLWPALQPPNHMAWPAPSHQTSEPSRPLFWSLLQACPSDSLLVQVSS